MKIKRKGKINRVNPTDFGLEELSKINKDNVVKVMDRSKERMGDRLSSETGLYVPKKDTADDIVKISSGDQNDNIQRKSSIKHKEDYNFGKTYAVGEQYLINDNYRYQDYSERNLDNFLYDDYDNYDEFSLDDFFEDKKIEVVVQREENDGDDSNDDNSDDAEISIADDSSDDVPKISKIDDSEHKEDNQTKERSVKNQNSGDDQAAALRMLTSQNEELKNQNVLEEEESPLTKQEENKLHGIIENIDRAANAKERLALEREAVRLGMAKALLEYDGSDTVKPELLDEIGFTPGGEKKPEIVRNNRFRFGKKSKEKSKENNNEFVNQNTKAETKKQGEEKVSHSTIVEKNVVDNKRKGAASPRKKTAMARERRSEIMNDSKRRRVYLLKNKQRIEKANKDLLKMQTKYDSLTGCLNDMVTFDSLFADGDKSIKNAAAMIVKYRNEAEKTKKNLEMDSAVYRRMDQNKDDIPSIIKRLAENEKYADKINSEIQKIENEKSECQQVSEENSERKRKTKNVSIAVIVVTVITMIALVVVQLISEIDMQIPILIFGACAILETLGIFVQHFKTESTETANKFKLNKLIKKQNAEKAKFVNAKNAVDYVYDKYEINSSSELLYQWETYQRVSQARDDYRIAENEMSYYEDRLFSILKDYGFNNPEVWVNNAEYLMESQHLLNIKEDMTEKRTKLMTKMEKCKKFIAKLEDELSVLIIKFPQYADEIKDLLA